MSSRENLFERRRRRMRAKIKKISGSKPRLSVFRSNAHMYAQLIDDQTEHTLASASTLDAKIVSKGKNGGNIDAARMVGTLIAKSAITAGVFEVVFDRSGFLYHGRVKALADAAREAGLKF